MLSESVRLCPGYYGGGCIEFVMNTDYCVQDERKQVPSMAERQEFSILWNLLWFVGLGAILAIPAGVISRRAGFSPYLFLVVFLPMGFLLLLAFLAFADWPAFQKDDGV